MRFITPALAVVVSLAAVVAALSLSGSEPHGASLDARWLLVSVSTITAEGREPTPYAGRMLIESSAVVLVAEDLGDDHLSRAVMNTPDGLLTLHLQDTIHDICETLGDCVPTWRAEQDEIEFRELVLEDGVRRGLLDEEAQRRAEQDIRERRGR